jgi:branched-subunit amino acid transport protein AzlD
MEKIFRRFQFRVFWSHKSSQYVALLLIALVELLGILIRKVYNGLKDYPTTWEQMVVGFLITFISIRFSNEVLSLNPTALYKWFNLQ